MRERETASGGMKSNTCRCRIFCERSPTLMNVPTHRAGDRLSDEEWETAESIYNGKDHSKSRTSLTLAVHHYNIVGALKLYVLTSHNSRRTTLRYSSTTSRSIFRNKHTCMYAQNTRTVVDISIRPLYFFIVLQQQKKAEL